MKKILLIVLLILPSFSFCQSEEWLTSLDAAKGLALVQDKMVLMIWEDSFYEPLPVVVKDKNGKRVFVENLFESQILINLLKDYFILVMVNEVEYEELYKPVKNNQSTVYINKFNDDSLKVMDANGYILNTNHTYYKEFLNLTEFIAKYANSTAFLKNELINYKTQQNFVTSFRLASQYIDLAIFTIKPAREEVISLSNIYLKNAEDFLLVENPDNKMAMIEKINLLKIKQELVLDNPKKVLRQLKRMDSESTDEINEPLIAFLKLTAYLLLKDEISAAPWRSKVSLLNLKKSNQIISNTN